MKPFLLSLIVLFLFASCRKEKLCIDGVIHWGGEPAVDGLGWYFVSASLGDKPVKLKNLPVEYQINEQPVSVCILKTNEKYQCFCATALDVYSINQIRKR